MSFKFTKEVSSLTRDSWYLGSFVPFETPGPKSENGRVCENEDEGDMSGPDVVLSGAFPTKPTVGTCAGGSVVDAANAELFCPNPDCPNKDCTIPGDVLFAKELPVGADVAAPKGPVVAVLTVPKGFADVDAAAPKGAVVLLLANILGVAVFVVLNMLGVVVVGPGVFPNAVAAVWLWLGAPKP
eukprot:jgi/Antlo1/843/1934